jgi:hypothetical protein
MTGVGANVPAAPYGDEELDFEALLARWQQADQEVAQSVSSALGSQGLAQAAQALLAELISADEWDIDPALYGMTWTETELTRSGLSGAQAAVELVEDRLEREAARGEPSPPEDIRDSILADAAERLGPELEAGDTGTGSRSLSLVAIVHRFGSEQVPDHPERWMPLQRIPDHYGAALFLAELWVKLSPKERAELAPNAPTDEQGRVEAWQVVAVNRAGDEVYARYYRGGPGLHLAGVDAEHWAHQKIDATGQVRVRAGALQLDHPWVDGLRRMLGLPSRLRQPRPYVLLLDHWASMVARILEGSEPRPGKLVGLLDARIDWVVARALLSINNDEPAASLSEAILARYLADTGMTPEDLDEETLDDHLRSQAGSEALGALLRRVDPLWPLLPNAGMEPIEGFAHYLEAEARRVSGEDGPGWSEELVAWYGPAMYLDQRVAPMTKTNAAGRLARDKRLPGWFRDSITRALNAASAIELH